MIRNITYRNKAYRKLKLKISPRARFNSILSAMNDIDFPGTPVKSEHIVYAILELVNNSLRAHQERREKSPILVEFAVFSSSLNVDIVDRGGGFDPTGLPFLLSSDTESVDINDEQFQDYRRRNQYKRFGMGFYIVKKTFNTFDLTFIDEDGKPTGWESKNVAGTKINLSLGEHHE